MSIAAHTHRAFLPLCVCTHVCVWGVCEHVWCVCGIRVSVYRVYTGCVCGVCVSVYGVYVVCVVCTLRVVYMVCIWCVWYVHCV